jgi:hypothetical protein
MLKRPSGAQPGVSRNLRTPSFDLGEAFQFDWSCEYVFVGGLRRRLEVAHVKLDASRAFWLVAYPTQSHEMLFDAHARAFAAFGGVPRRGIYDNMKTAVDKVGRGKERTVNARFEAMCSHYLFEPEFCNRAAGWEKGIVEKNVQDRRRQIWHDAAQRRWDSLETLNEWVSEQCHRAWQMRHPQWPELTVEDVLQDERTRLMPNPRPFDGYVDTKECSGKFRRSAKTRDSIRLRGFFVARHGKHPVKTCVRRAPVRSRGTGHVRQRAMRVMRGQQSLRFRVLRW